MNWSFITFVVIILQFFYSNTFLQGCLVVFTLFLSMSSKQKIYRDGLEQWNRKLQSLMNLICWATHGGVGVWGLGFFFGGVGCFFSLVKNKVFLSSAATVVSAEKDQAILSCSTWVNQAAAAFQCNRFMPYANHSQLFSLNKWRQDRCFCGWKARWGKTTFIIVLYSFSATEHVLTDVQFSAMRL